MWRPCKRAHRVEHGKGATTVAPFLFCGELQDSTVMKRAVLARLGLLFGWSCLGGCASERAVIASPANIERSETVPAGYVSLGTARAHCRPLPAWGPLYGEPLRNFDCSTARIRRTLAEQASRAGGTLLAFESCEADAKGGRNCSATIARPERANAAAPGRVGVSSGEVWDPSDAPRADAIEVIRIDLDLDPAAERFARRARTASDVAEPALLPVSHVELGELRARCDADECADAELRLGLRLAAGSLGASDLVNVACHALDGERSCAGTLATTERDPETDATAH